MDGTNSRVEQDLKEELNTVKPLSRLEEILRGGLTSASQPMSRIEKLLMDYNPGGGSSDLIEYDDILISFAFMDGFNEYGVNTVEEAEVVSIDEPDITILT